MLCLVTGGSGSGKSEFAEKIACGYAANKGDKAISGSSLYYVATMKPYLDEAGKMDEETEKRISRHRRMRKDKGFTTIECYNNIGSLDFDGDAVVLLECMSNLLANEMYSCDCPFTDVKAAITGIAAPLIELSGKLKCLVVVTNEVFSDGRVSCYDESTRLYIESLAAINRELAAHADLAYEVCCGIPVKL